MLRIKWVYLVYIKDIDWWDYKAPMNASWCWKNICKVKEKMRAAYNGNQWLNSRESYNIKAGYKWLHQDGEKIRWYHWVWNSFIVPKHSFIS